MTLFAASVVIWMRAKRQPGQEEEGPCHFWERVLLIRAGDPDAATQKASEFGLHDAETNSVDLVDENGTPSELVFMGVRKLREVEASSPTGDPDITEVTASEMEVSGTDDLINFARGGTVMVRQID
jgi:hypothetical protein